MTAPFRLLLPAAAMLCVVSTAAYADSIDGDWCHTDGRNLTIAGSSIRTPGGAAMTGSYGRHDFSYVAPPAEPNKGQTIAMRLLDENTVSVRVSGLDAPAQTWKRCRLGTS